MKILALEFSTELRSAALVETGQGIIPKVLGSAVETAPRSVGALGLVVEVLRQAGLEREAVECLAVGLGPGSYAGIRAAISLAQGWQLAREVKLIGISTVESLAATAHERGWHGRVNIALNAQRNELYLAGYEIADEGWRLVEELRLIPVSEAQVLAGDGRLFLGPEVRQWFPAGRQLNPEAAMLGKLAAKGDKYVSGEELEPIYLRETNFVKAPPPRIVE